MGNRCTGACCLDIGLRVSPEEMKESYEAWLKKPNLVMANGNKNSTIWHEIWLIYPMLKFLRKDKIHPEFPWQKQLETIYHYECKHFDKKKKICTIYDSRPDMCSSYPNKEYCANPECKWIDKCKTRPPEIKKEIRKYRRESRNGI